LFTFSSTFRGALLTRSAIANFLAFRGRKRGSCSGSGRSGKSVPQS